VRDGYLHGVGDVFSLGEYLGEVLGAEDVAERGLCEQAGRMMGVLDVGDRHDRAADPVVDDRVDRHRHRVLRQHLIVDPNRPQQLRQPAADVVQTSVHLDKATCYFFAMYSVIGPVLWGHSGPLCHALSLSSSLLLWTSIAIAIAQAACDSSATPGPGVNHNVKQRRAAARSGERAQHFSNASCCLCYSATRAYFSFLVELRSV